MTAIFKTSIPCDTLLKLLHSMTPAGRAKCIKDWLTKYAKREIDCPGLGDVVRLTNSGIDETAHHASKRVESTLLAFNLVPLIEAATDIFNTYAPKGNRRQKQMKIQEMYELHVITKYLGTAKLMIGKNKKGFFVHYCCTALRNTENDG
jgi:hypothetical protein